MEEGTSYYLLHSQGVFSAWREVRTPAKRNMYETIFKMRMNGFPNSGLPISGF